MAEIAENPQGGGKGKAKKQSTKVDLTAMVDLAFLLITFFMFTTTLAKPKAMQIALPDTSGPVDKNPEVDDDVIMTVLLAPKNVVLYYFGKPEVAAADPDGVKSTTFDKIKGIRKVILDKKKAVEALGPLGKDKNGNNKTMVLIKATDSSVYGNMVDMLDEMHITDIKFYALLPISEPEKVLVDNAMKKAVQQ